MSIFDKRVATFLKNEERVALYNEGIEKLRQSGVLDLMVRIGIPNFVKGGSDLNAMAAQAAFSSGYQTCLEHLTDFVDKFSEVLDIKKFDKLAADFGGDAAAVSSGLLTKDDIT